MTDDELLRVRDRIHKLNDMVLSHDTKLAQHDVLIHSLTTTVESVRGEMSTREQLDSAVKLFTLSLNNFVSEMGLKLQAVHSDLDPIKRGVYWLVGLVFTTIVLALLALVLKK